jgi:hypothetical protein
MDKVLETNETCLRMVVQIGYRCRTLGIQSDSGHHLNLAAILQSLGRPSRPGESMTFTANDITLRAEDFEGLTTRHLMREYIQREDGTVCIRHYLTDCPEHTETTLDTYNIVGETSH